MIINPLTINLKNYKSLGLQTSPDISIYSCIAIRNDGIMYIAGKGTSYVFRYVHSKSIFCIDLTKKSIKGKHHINYSKQHKNQYQ